MTGSRILASRCTTGGTGQTPVMIVFFQFMVYMLIVTVFPVAKWLCWIFLGQRTRVYFDRNRISINGKKFAVQPHIGIQFCAYRMPLAERYVNREHPRQADYLIRFRLIEMIYGARVVKITSIDNEEKAKSIRHRSANRL